MSAMKKRRFCQCTRIIVLAMMPPPGNDLVNPTETGNLDGRPSDRAALQGLSATTARFSRSSRFRSRLALPATDPSPCAAAHARGAPPEIWGISLDAASGCRNDRRRRCSPACLRHPRIEGGDALPCIEEASVGDCAGNPPPDNHWGSHPTSADRSNSSGLPARASSSCGCSSVLP